MTAELGHKQNSNAMQLLQCLADTAICNAQPHVSHNYTLPAYVSS